MAWASCMSLKVCAGKRARIGVSADVRRTPRTWPSLATNDSASCLAACTLLSFLKEELVPLGVTHGQADQNVGRHHETGGVRRAGAAHQHQGIQGF